MVSSIDHLAPDVAFLPEPEPINGIPVGRLCMVAAYGLGRRHSFSCEHHAVSLRPSDTILTCSIAITTEQQVCTYLMSLTVIE